MKFANINLGRDVEIDPSSSINNVVIGDNVKIAKRCSIYGGPDNQLEIGANSYIGMGSLLNGFVDKLTIGENVSISQHVNIMVESGPNASPSLQKIFPISKGPVIIENDTWIGASAIIMPNVKIGKYSVIAANSFVNSSFPSFSIIGGSPARLIRSLTEQEKEQLLSNEDNCDLTKKISYDKKYNSIPFESYLVDYRRRFVIENILQHRHENILEIGCGNMPIFKFLSDYSYMTVVEPCEIFYQNACKIADNDKITVYNDFFENITGDLKMRTYDFIVVSSLLHEVTNVSEFLEKIREISNPGTTIHFNVPNADSFHRRLAVEMGIAGSVFENSSNNVLMGQKRIFNLKMLTDILLSNKFHIIDSGSYYIKPFTHLQMQKLIDCEIIDSKVLDGLSGMTRYLPDLGCEIFANCTI